MKVFADLISALQNTDSSKKANLLLSKFFAGLSSLQLAWAVYLFSGNQSRFVIKAQDLRKWAQEEAEIQDWLFELCYKSTGELLETISLILPLRKDAEAADFEQYVHALESFHKSDGEKRACLLRFWRSFGEKDNYILNKILSSKFSSPVRAVNVQVALSKLLNCSEYDLCYCLSLPWYPTEEFLPALSAQLRGNFEHLRPYEFAQERAVESEDLSVDFAEVTAEWKFDGLDIQLVKRRSEVFLWSKESELLNCYFPEIVGEAEKLSDGVVLSGQLLPFKDAELLSRADLDKRISRPADRKTMHEIPVVFMVSDIYEDNGKPLADLKFWQRSQLLALALSRRKQIASPEQFEQLSLFAPCQLQLSNVLRPLPNFDIRGSKELQSFLAQCCKMRAKGLSLRKKNECLNESNEILFCPAQKKSVLAVLVAAQKSESDKITYNRLHLAVWRDKELVPIARANTDCLSAEEQLLVHEFVGKNILKRFGPVANVKSELVFELAFSGFDYSKRHKSGLLLKDVKLLRYCPELSSEKAFQLQQIRELLN